jgi:Zn-dependent protease
VDISGNLLLLWEFKFHLMLQFIYIVFALVLVITFHEFAHAYTAYLLGDPTAKNKGRVTLNPLAHLDPMGTILIFLVGIGWGKPVPVNRAYFRKPIAHEALVAVAGPIMNLIIALIVMVPLKYFGQYMNFELNLLLRIIFDMSIVLFAFNMLPFPPLDGSKFLQLIIPKRWQHHYQQYLMNASVYFLIFLVVDNFLFAKYFGFSVLSSVIGWLVAVTKMILFWGG